MSDDGDAARAEKYPSSEEGGDGSDEDMPPKSRQKKIRKKGDSDELISYQNAQQAGLDGRKPLELSQTVDHCLRDKMEFESRWAAELYITEIAARDDKIFLKNGFASSFDGGLSKSKDNFRASIGIRDPRAWTRASSSATSTSTGSTTPTRRGPAPT
mmetsp:Transcript_943/g.3013  ORF Transcript_943/g.3013 Transcript_943/m.3013 type:complete len:157 (-) Transcript_943:1271-1741(-)